MQGMCASSLRALSGRVHYAAAHVSRSRRGRLMCSAAGDGAYKLNVNLGVDKKYETKSFKELAKMPPGVLQGLAEGKADEALKQLRITTVEELGRWKYYTVAKTIATLAAVEQPGGRAAGNSQNVNSAVDKQHESASFKDMLALPPSALQGLAPASDVVLAGLGVKSVGDLAAWKYAAWAEAIAGAAGWENEDFSAR